MTFYFLTFATAAWGYALLAWLAIILRKEPEARSVIVGLAVTLVYIGHATIPLRAWRTADFPRYPVGFPMAAAFSVGGIVAILGMYWYVRKYPDILEFGLKWKTVSSSNEVPVSSIRRGSANFEDEEIVIQDKDEPRKQLVTVADTRKTLV